MKTVMAACVYWLVVACVVAAPKATLAELASMPDQQLAKYDIAYLNLLCAAGLPSGETIPTHGALRKLDYWAAWIKKETDKNMYRFHREPKKFRNSEAYYKMALLVTIVAQDFKCRYNPQRGTDPAKPEPAKTFFADSQDLFIHGFLGKRKIGTCSSFPVLFAALGRRLGYPVKLVTTKAHLFCRWESEKESFNIEGTGGGIAVHTNDHYKRFPYKITDKFIAANGHLVSLSPKGELACFLSARVECLIVNNRFDEALECTKLTAKLMPEVSYYQRLLKSLETTTKNKGK